MVRARFERVVRTLSEIGGATGTESTRLAHVVRDMLGASIVAAAVVGALSGLLPSSHQGNVSPRLAPAMNVPVE